MIRNIFYTSKFEKNFKRLPRNIKVKALNKQKLFVTSPMHPSLKTHKLRGELSGFSSFSIDRSYRILFAWENTTTVTFIDIGTHEIYN